MKATVWTSWKSKGEYDDVKPKCIFSGEIAHLPQIGVGIVVRDGFCVEMIRHVYYDLITGEVEIGIESCDPNNEYPEVKP